MDSIATLLERISNAPKAEEELNEPRFFQVLSDVEKGEYESALLLLRDLFNEGYFDIRLIAYYLYIHIVNTGREGIKDSLRLFPVLLSEQRAKLYPISDRNKQSISALNWFYSTLVKSLKRAAERVKSGGVTPLWESLIENLTNEKLDSLQDAFEASTEFFRREFQGDFQLEEAMAYLNTWIRDLRAFLLSEPPPPEQAEDEVKEAGLDQEPSSECLKPSVEEKPLESKASQLQVPLSRESLTQPSTEDSYFWRRLKAKLALFERLASDKSPDAELKRAIVSNDICHEIESFNPALYFPQNFTTFYTLMAQKGEPLSVEAGSASEFGWNVLSSLYQIDFDQFEKWSRS